MVVVSSVAGEHRERKMAAISPTSNIGGCVLNRGLQNLITAGTHRHD
jgi:hypothetical protein